MRRRTCSGASLRASAAFAARTGTLCGGRGPAGRCRSRWWQGRLHGPGALSGASGAHLLEPAGCLRGKQLENCNGVACKGEDCIPRGCSAPSLSGAATAPQVPVGSLPSHIASPGCDQEADDRLGWDCERVKRGSRHKRWPSTGACSADGAHVIASTFSIWSVKSSCLVGMTPATLSEGQNLLPTRKASLSFLPKQRLSAPFAV